MKKILKKEIEIHIQTDNIYCGENCYYKQNTICNLFAEETGYNYKLDKPKRCKKCLYYFVGQIGVNYEKKEKRASSWLNEQR